MKFPPNEPSPVDRDAGPKPHPVNTPPMAHKWPVAGVADWAGTESRNAPKHSHAGIVRGQ
jgi:hypothetical protein